MRDLEIMNPKRSANHAGGRESWYSYYAGYSSTFALGLLRSLAVREEAVVLDPWNGVGTTTTAAAVLGRTAYGFDLNPVMATIGKAMLVPAHEVTDRCRELDAAILRRRVPAVGISSADPLLAWFTPAGVQHIRTFEQHLLGQVAKTGWEPMDVDCVSQLQAFAYLVLFKCVRQLLRGFYASNPTWLKRPGSPSERLRPSVSTIRETLVACATAAHATAATFAQCAMPTTANVTIRVASSLKLPVSDRTVDVVLTSPPYCTRIDYAVATGAELAVLGYGDRSGFRELRQALLGTSTISQVNSPQTALWGRTCSRFLDRVWHHDSKASRSYYYPNLVSYFEGLHSSLAEIARVLKRNAKVIIVVQDSYYKDIHNDLPRVVTEMGEGLGLRLTQDARFAVKSHMANKNPRIERYRARSTATEAVLCFVPGGPDSVS